MIVSASQFKTFKACPRKWWFEKVVQLPQGPSKSRGALFGSVLHKVIERYLKADANGRDVYGEPVDPYPDGWPYDADSGEWLTDEEQAEVKVLVTLAVEQGVLRRHPDQRIEQDFYGLMLQGPGIFGPHVFVQGFIDVIDPVGVIDHKSMRTSRSALSPDKLAEDDQILLYAKFVLEERRRRGEDPKVLTVQHNCFVRQPEPRVFVREAIVEVEHIDRRWVELQERAGAMQALALANIPEQRWKDVPCALDVEPARCNDYGGCPYLQVCGGYETTKKFRKRLDRLALCGTMTTEETNMGLLDRLRQSTQAVGAPEAAPRIAVNPPLQAFEDLAASAPPLEGDDTNKSAPAPSQEPSPPSTTEHEVSVSSGTVTDVLLTEPATGESEGDCPSSGSAGASPSPGRRMKAPTKAELLARAEAAERRCKELEEALRRANEVLDADQFKETFAWVPLIVMSGAMLHSLPEGVRGSCLMPAGALAEIAELDGGTMEEFLAADPFKRRDVFYLAVKRLVNDAVAEGKTLIVQGVARTPDEKALLSAFEQHADMVIAAVAA